MPMIPNGSQHGASAGPLSYSQDFSQPHADRGLLNPNAQVQQQQQPLSVQQNPWQQPLLGIPQHQQLPPLNMLAQQAQFSQMPWPNQIPQPQQLQNAMLQMAPFNMPLISQQILQEALAMAQPVDASDEPVLLTALLKAKKSERNFKEALNGLHGTNGHSGSLWKDYYLEHKDRFDDWIEMCIKKERSESTNQANATSSLSGGMEKDPRRVSLSTVKKPSPASFKSGPLAKSSIPSRSAPPHKKKLLSPKQFSTVEGRGRNTMNSLSVPEPVFDGRLPPPNSAIKVPDPPSRSPSPPTNIVFQGRGNKFTKEDREFFISFIGWRLQHDPTLNRQDLCDMLAEKAQHHSAGSWASFWSNNHDLPDKILASARGEIDESSDEKDDTQKQRPNYRDLTTSEDESESERGKDETDEDEIGGELLHRYSESEMGEKGGPFNKADRYITARYIASTPNWHELKYKDRWEAYHKKHPQRSAKAWAECYRRYGQDLLKLANRIKRENNSSSILTQCGRPTMVPPKAKRKLTDEGSDGEQAFKRSKIEDSE